MDSQQPSQQPQQPYDYYNQSQPAPLYSQPLDVPPSRAPDKSMGFAIAGLVLGIIAIISSWVPIFGLPIPIIGIVMSALGRRSVSYRTMATVGLVLSIIALVISLIITVIVFAAASHSSS